MIVGPDKPKPTLRSPKKKIWRKLATAGGGGERVTGTMLRRMYSKDLGGLVFELWCDLIKYFHTSWVFVNATNALSCWQMANERGTSMRDWGEERERG